MFNNPDTVKYNVPWLGWDLYKIKSLYNDLQEVPPTEGAAAADTSADRGAVIKTWTSLLVLLEFIVDGLAIQPSAANLERLQREINKFDASKMTGISSLLHTIQELSNAQHYSDAKNLTILVAWLIVNAHLVNKDVRSATQKKNEFAEEQRAAREEELRQEREEEEARREARERRREEERQRRAREREEARRNAYQGAEQSDEEDEAGDRQDQEFDDFFRNFFGQNANQRRHNYQQHGRQNHHEEPAEDPAEKVRKAYERLGIAQGSDVPVYKKAYRQLARANHPDMFSTASDEKKAEQQNILKEINAAYDVLNKHHKVT